MKKKILVFAALLAVSAAPVWAAGVNLGWNDCPSGGTYAQVKTFACSTNAGINTLVGSFVAPSGINQMSANEVVIDVQTGTSSFLAPWWTFGTGQCRAAASLAGNFDFTGGPFTCYDYWQAGAIGAFNWSIVPNAPNLNRCRLKAVFALPAGDARITSVPVDLEVYSFKCNINNAKSTGLGACAGCNAEACIVLNEITINQPAPDPPRTPITNPAAAAHVIWQAWTTVDPNNLCPAVTPTRNQTWGSIKALYR